jgi:hypothetical protein
MIQAILGDGSWTRAARRIEVDLVTFVMTLEGVAGGGARRASGRDGVGVESILDKELRVTS